jgi:hypothetical protein
MNFNETEFEMYINMVADSILPVTFKKIPPICWVLAAHTCNPSYSGGRDEEDCS